MSYGLQSPLGARMGTGRGPTSDITAVYTEAGKSLKIFFDLVPIGQCNAVHPQYFSSTC